MRGGRVDYSDQRSLPKESNVPGPPKDPFFLDSVRASKPLAGVTDTTPNNSQAEWRSRARSHDQETFIVKKSKGPEPSRLRAGIVDSLRNGTAR